MTDERALAFVHELEQADEAVAAVLAELDELARETETIGARAVDLEAKLIRIPAERERVATASAQAEREAEARRRDLNAAEDALRAAERTDDAKVVAAARRASTRARDAATMAQRKVESLAADSARLDAEAAAAEREAVELEERSHALAELLRARSGLAEQAGADPEPGLPGVAGWASQARAALFVARGRLAAEREAVIRQANELGALVLGEPLSASSAALVARRIERASDRRG